MLSGLDALIARRTAASQTDALALAFVIIVGGVASHSRSSIKKNQHLCIKLAKDTIRGAARRTPGEQLR